MLKEKIVRLAGFVNRIIAHRFLSARRKLERAHRHIDDLEREFKAFVKRKPHRLSVKQDEVTGQPVIQVRFVEPVPDAFGIIVGDAIHNMRCAMDHTMWELIGLDRGKQHKHLQFVCRTDPGNYRGTIKSIDTPSQWVRDYLQGLECFAGGKGHVYLAISDLDNADKHQVMTPVLRATKHPAFQIFYRDGTEFLRMEGNTFIASGAPDRIEIHDVPPGGYVEFDDDTDCAPLIFLPDIRGGNAIDALRHFSEAVSRLIKETDAAVAKNSA